MKDGGIDAGLALLAYIAEPGETMTCDDIAYVCGVSKQRINQIERKAIAKCRAKFRELEAVCATRRA